MNVMMEENKEEVYREGKARDISKKSRENAPLSTQVVLETLRQLGISLKESNDKPDVLLPYNLMNKLHFSKVKITLQFDE